MALVQSKRHSSVGIGGRRESTVTTRTGGGDFGTKTRQAEKLSKLEAKYSKVVIRQEQLQNPFYFQELRAQ